MTSSLYPVFAFVQWGNSPNDVPYALATGLVFAIGAWIGHAYWLTGLLNNLYGRPISKFVLRSVRALVGVLILSFPAILWMVTKYSHAALLFGPYVWACAVIGLLWFPIVTVYRALRPRPRCVLGEQTETVDYAKLLEPKSLLGEGKWKWLPRLPLNDVHRVDFTALTLAVPGLPTAWDGLKVLVLSDLHFHGTPSRAWYDAIFDRLSATAPPDLVVLAGDYVDTDRHVEWLSPILSRLKWLEHAVAVLGNHDLKHLPRRIREELVAAGYRVLDNRWELVRLRGEPCAIVGHEGPWFDPPPNLTGLPADVFKLCISHTPDNYDWGIANGMNLMLCGHVHGGQIRLPIIGSIFVPSRYGRRFDMGVFAAAQTVMVVGRGLSGKEPLRFRCRPQVITLTLKPG